MTYDELIDNVRHLRPMALSRWGDGEWLTIREAPGGNCDGNLYYPELGRRLKQIVSVPQPYVMGAQFHDHLPSDREKYDQDWIDADILHRASMREELGRFSEALKNVPVVYIGNETLSTLPFINEFIEIPYNNVWNQYNQVIDQITEHLGKQTKVFLFSAGMAANVFVHDMWTGHPTNLYLDVGSVFDPYVGRNSRSYHQKLKLSAL